MEHDLEAQAGYRRSTGSRRGEARCRDLLDRVTQDLATNGLVDFSLRRAARSAGTTHKVLLYYFDGVDDLLKQAVVQLRGRRIEGALAAAQASGHHSLADRVQSMWPVLTAVESGQLALDQAIGLAMYDPDRYAELGRGASDLYLPGLRSICPEHWPDRRKEEVSQMILAALRGSWSTGAPVGPLTGPTPGSRPWFGHLSGRRPQRTEVRSKSNLGTKRKLKRIQYRPELIDGCLTETGLIMTAT